MQTSIGAMFRATFNTSETLPLGDDGPDRSRSDRGFKRRRQASRFRTVAKRYHGFARHFATEGDHTIRGRDDGVLRPCTQILERPCGRRTTLIHRCRACRAMTCQNATERGIRWDA